MPLSQRISVLAIIILMMTVIPTFNVQSQAAYDCSKLAAADCKVLQAADANLAKELSGKFTVEFSGNFTAGTNTGSYNVTGNGAFSVDPSQASAAFGSADYLNGLNMNLELTGYSTSFINGVNAQQQISTGIVIADGVGYTRVSKTPLLWRGEKISDMVVDFGSAFNRSLLNSPNGSLA